MYFYIREQMSILARRTWYLMGGLVYKAHLSLNKEYPFSLLLGLPCALGTHCPATTVPSWPSISTEQQGRALALQVR